MAIPEIEGIDYTIKEYLKFVHHIQAAVTRLNTSNNSSNEWSPHTVELAIWTHYIVSDYKPELLESLTENGNSINHQNGDSVGAETSDESNQGPINGNSKLDDVLDENTTTSFTEDSMDKPSPPVIPNEETCDSVVSESTNDSTSVVTSSLKRPLASDEDDSSSLTNEESSNNVDEEQPTSKKSKIENSADKWPH